MIKIQCRGTQIFLQFGAGCTDTYLCGIQQPQTDVYCNTYTLCIMLVCVLLESLINSREDRINALKK